MRAGQAYQTLIPLTLNLSREGNELKLGVDAFVFTAIFYKTPLRLHPSGLPAGSRWHFSILHSICNFAGASPNATRPFFHHGFPRLLLQRNLLSPAIPRRTKYLTRGFSIQDFQIFPFCLDNETSVKYYAVRMDLSFSR